MEYPVVKPLSEFKPIPKEECTENLWFLKEPERFCTVKCEYEKVADFKPIKVTLPND